MIERKEERKDMESKHSTSRRIRKTKVDVYAGVIYRNLNPIEINLSVKNPARVEIKKLGQMFATCLGEMFF